ncbi:ubiquitin D-like isoform X2 [Mustela erminea]|uniref:ubiquitin D-like isoform X2 n=1 Tax=Mustela erminea TaxID=36723 RepID=UPI001386CC5A|nr:ubiquitin D-like isoform X2 [Mustela erminea]
MANILPGGSGKRVSEATCLHSRDHFQGLTGAQNRTGLWRSSTTVKRRPGCRGRRGGTRGRVVFLLVTVSSEGRTSMTFAANSDDTVRKIKEHVRAKTKIPVQDQVLLLGSKMLKPQRRLSSYGIDKETTIHLTLKVVMPSDEELPVTLVQSCDGGQRHLLQVRRSSSVAQVKQMIETKTAIAPEQQIVTCNGKRLEDGKTMADYGIRRGASLWLADYCIGG